MNIESPKDILLGVSYYPEQYPEARWRKDAELMKRAGITVVRMAEFTWALLQPSEHSFDFGWLDRAIELFAGHGISVVLGTPTSVCPAWLLRSHPEVMRTMATGGRVGWGFRGHSCANSDAYRSAAAGIVSALAKRYGHHEAVVGWQLDNEFIPNRCYCANCDAAFRRWLGQRYGSLEALNAAWGTMFWSQRFSSWDEVETPKVPDESPRFQHGSSIMLDFYRFASDTTLSFANLQVDLLRKEISGSQFITHNFMGLFDGIDGFEFAERLDFIGWDSYRAVSGGFQLGQHHVSLAHALMRGLKASSYWMLEQQCGYFNYGGFNPARRPGEVRLWTYDDIAHGADAVLYYRWGGSRFGREQNANSLLRHDGTPGRALSEVEEVSKELARVGARIAATRPEAECAIIWDYEALWATQHHSLNERFEYREHVSRYYYAFWRMNVPVDVVSLRSDLSRYKLVVAPTLFALSEESARRLGEYAQGGGTLVLTPMTGVETESGATTDRPMPAWLDAVAGVRVLEFDSQPPSYVNRISLARGKGLAAGNHRAGGAPSGAHPVAAAPAAGTAPAAAGEYEIDCYLEMLELRGAVAVGVYSGDFYAGSPAVTLKASGRGRTYYIGAIAKPDFYLAFIGGVLADLAIEPLMTTSENVQVTRRRSAEGGGGSDLYFVLNFGDAAASVKLDRAYDEILTGKALAGEVSLAPRDVLILAARS